MGAQGAIPVRREFLFKLIVFLLLLPTQGSPDSNALQNFRSSLNNNAALSNWNDSTPPCDANRTNWAGVLCLDGNVYGLQLEHMGLSGNINVDALHALPFLRSLSFMDNAFEGGLPSFSRLGKLKALYLSNNMFSGEISDDVFKGMGSLKRLFLANNQLTGRIPAVLTSLMRLEELKLEGNQFYGEIPVFRQENLKINVASNDLTGPIPTGFGKLSPSSFSGNKGLCGQPLGPCNATDKPLSPPVPGHHKRAISDGDHVIIRITLAIVGLTLLVIVIVLVILCRRTYRQDSDQTQLLVDKLEDSHVAPSETHVRRGENTSHGKLTFLRDDVEKFALQDLLKASAEVLGSGTFGASYKAVVVAGQPLVVKRYRHMNTVAREDFHEHMRRIGRLHHPNLLPLVAYYCRREERLIVTEFIEMGSLASHLHGKHSLKETLDWPTRLKIVKGIARGLSYLYKELPMMVPHGHLKSSNVLLGDSHEPLLMDYALRPVVDPDHAHSILMAYKSPEYTTTGQTSNKTDIWSFGILILEILTGKYPENYLTPGYNRNADLATWVNKMVSEKRTGEVFDKEMNGTKDNKGEMIDLLKVGLSCCEEDLERRMEIKEMVEKIEGIKDGDESEGSFVGDLRTFSVKYSEEEYGLSALDR